MENAGLIGPGDGAKPRDVNVEKIDQYFLKSSNRYFTDPKRFSSVPLSKPTMVLSSTVITGTPI